jgi:beta-ureidopropionase / N-carbamoyl-L-amino-acid hydrolase
MTLFINPDRFKADFDALAQIGAFEDSDGNRGVNRPALSPEHLAARRWFLARADEAGPATRVDPAGNHSAILRAAASGGAHSNAPAPGRTLLLGSHLDSVPNGERFDGALGVLAALEAARTIQEAGLALPLDLEVIDFTDEEGTLVGELGSAALAGALSPETLAPPRTFGESRPGGCLTDHGSQRNMGNLISMSPAYDKLSPNMRESPKI